MSNDINPKVSVIMSVYNGEKYLREAIDSILNQTFTDFEFIIINDGSTDKTKDILESYFDPRLRIIHQENVGLTESLNRGIGIARGKYIARQDADDISLPRRLELQLTYLERHPQVALLGTWARTIDKDGNAIKEMRYPTNPNFLRWRMLFNNNLIHSSVMFNAEKIRQLGGYNIDLARAQDYDLWLRIMMRHEIAQLSEVLLQWRDHPKNITSTYSEDQENVADWVVWSNIQNLLKRDVAIKEVKNLRAISDNGPVSSSVFLNSTSDILHDLFDCIIKRWHPNSEDTQMIARDYSMLMITIASINANLRREGTLNILKKAFKNHKRSILETSSMKCILKIILGPKLVSKTRKFFGIYLQNELCK